MILISYYIISLSLIYYSLGISKITLIAWLIVNLIIFIILNNNKNLNRIYIPRQDTSNLINDKTQIIIFLLIIYLLSYLFANPITNGSPSPWIHIGIINIFAFFVLTILFIKDAFLNQNTKINLILYIFLILSIVAIRYTLSYGYDSLIHQASLQYIFSHGQITPLTPFYVGQYVLELLINFSTKIGFVFIERWIGVIISVLMLFATSKYLLENIKTRSNLSAIPISILLMSPSIFFFTSPYALSLLFSMISCIFLFIYLKNNKKLDIFLTLLLATVSIFIHPFVGLTTLGFLIFIPFIKIVKKYTKKILLYAIATITSSLIVVFCFALYSWLNNYKLILMDPIYYFNNFLNLFGDPIWYQVNRNNIFSYIIYLYEKFHIFIIFAFSTILFIFTKKTRKEGFYIILISLCFLISSWLFISLIEIPNYTYGDQINYSYRLLQASKWMLYPIILLSINSLLLFVKNKNILIQITFSLIFSIVLIATLYITYPRVDSISLLNVNNIRSVDYKALDFIYNKEGGKNEYIVFANQIFGAGAIQKYSFGPYYNSSWGSLMYYSVPMGSELNIRYEKLMNLKELDPNLIYEVLKDTKIKKAYIIITDYWPLNEGVKNKLIKESKATWNIDKSIDIYFMALNP